MIFNNLITIISDNRTYITTFAVFTDVEVQVTVLGFVIF